MAIRESEVDELIREMSSPSFLNSNFGFPVNALMDMTKLILGGHSFGGLTAIHVAEKDPRIKAVFTFDPWVWARNTEILSGDLKIRVPSMHILTEGFDTQVEKYFNYNTEHSLENLLSNSTGKIHEMIVFNEINHYHQTDAVCIAPLECMVKSQSRPHHNVADIYLLNTQALMIFLHKTGFNRSFDPERLKYRIKEYEKKFFNYKFRLGEQITNEVTMEEGLPLCEKDSSQSK